MLICRYTVYYKLFVYCQEKDNAGGGSLHFPCGGGSGFASVLRSLITGGVDYGGQPFSGIPGAQGAAAAS